MSINGGGVRGLVPAKILEKITKDTGKQIHELFDYIVGTSAGGIIAIALTVKDENGNPKYTPSDVVKLFREEASEIFPPNIFYNMPVLGSILNLLGPKYSREGIDNLLERKLGNATFLDTTIPISTLSYSLDSNGPRLWSTYKAQLNPEIYNYFLRDAAGATSAAPTFFPTKSTKSPDNRTMHDIDGGIFANSPTIIGVTEFLNNKLFHMRFDKVIVLSLGTGKFKDAYTEYTHYDTDNEQSSKIGLTAGISACGISFLLGFYPGLACSFATLVGGLYDLYNSNTWSASTAPVSANLGTFLCSSVLAGFGLNLISGGICIISFSTSALFTLGSIAYHNQGSVNWITKNDLISKMMIGAEVSDVFQSQLVDVIRINPAEFDVKYFPMDNSNHEHLHNFSETIDYFLTDEEKVVRTIINCIEPKEYDEDKCRYAEDLTSSEKFGGQNFYSDLLGSEVDFLY